MLTLDSQGRCQAFGYDQTGNLINVIDYESSSSGLGSKLNVQYVVRFQPTRNEVKILRYQSAESLGQDDPSGIYVGGTDYYYFERNGKRYLSLCTKTGIDGQFQHWMQVDWDTESHLTGLRYHRGRWDGSSEPITLQSAQPYFNQWFDMWGEFGKGMI
jgi:hypothetical protein